MQPNNVIFICWLHQNAVTGVGGRVHVLRPSKNFRFEATSVLMAPPTFRKYSFDSLTSLQRESQTPSCGCIFINIYLSFLISRGRKLLRHSKSSPARKVNDETNFVFIRCTSRHSKDFFLISVAKLWAASCRQLFNGPTKADSRCW